jgi:N utilization substance protein B
MGKRRRARELALQYLYQWDFHGPESEEAATLFWEAQHDPDEVKKFARAIVDGVKDKKAEIDSLIEAQSRHWKLYRMSRVDRNVLRMAVFELMGSDTPPKVSIDEAIEVGKKFGTSDSGAFINGILDQISRKLGKITPPETDEAHEHPGDRDPR